MNELLWNQNYYIFQLRCFFVCFSRQFELLSAPIDMQSEHGGHHPITHSQSLCYYMLCLARATTILLSFHLTVHIYSRLALYLKANREQQQQLHPFFDISSFTASLVTDHYANFCIIQSISLVHVLAVRDCRKGTIQHTNCRCALLVQLQWMFAVTT